MKTFWTSTDWITDKGNPETTAEYITAANEDEALDVQRTRISKRKNWLKTVAGNACEVPSIIAVCLSPNLIGLTKDRQYDVRSSQTRKQYYWLVDDTGKTVCRRKTLFAPL